LSGAAPQAASAGEDAEIAHSAGLLQHQVAAILSYENARAQAKAIPGRTIMPQVAEEGGKVWLTILTGAGYPVKAELLEKVARG